VAAPLSVVGGWLVAVALVLVPMPRSLRYRLRLAAPTAARRADRFAGAALPLIAAAILALLVATLRPGSPPSLRLWLVGAAIGLATGVPFALERRSLRRRVSAIAPLAEPSAVGAHTTAGTRAAAEALDGGDTAGAETLLAPLVEAGSDPEALRLAALLSARTGRARAARLQALSAAQLDPARWDALLDTGVALCRRGRFAEGVRLLERGAELSGRSRPALLLLAAGDATAGRLREAASALDEANGVSEPRPR
jgi:tetratricopeptide (TPR) repeat protein